MWILYVIGVSVGINLLVLLVVSVPESKGTGIISRAWNAFRREIVQDEK